jgi:hypothetical protein
MSNDESGNIRALPAYVHGAFVEQPDARRYDEDMRARAFVLWTTEAGRNCAAVARLLAEEFANEGLNTPHRSVIAVWASQDDWANQADEMWRNTRLWSARQLQTVALGNVLLASRRRQEVLLGKYDEDIGAGLLMLKAGELADRLVRDVLPLDLMSAPPEMRSVDEEASLSTGEKATLARTRLIRRVKGEQANPVRVKSREERKREAFSG